MQSDRTYEPAQAPCMQPTRRAWSALLHASVFLARQEVGRSPSFTYVGGRELMRARLVSRTTPGATQKKRHAAGPGHRTPRRLHEIENVQTKTNWQTYLGPVGWKREASVLRSEQIPASLFNNVSKDLLLEYFCTNVFELLQDLPGRPIEIAGDPLLHRVRQRSKLFA